MKHTALARKTPLARSATLMKRHRRGPKPAKNPLRNYLIRLYSLIVRARDGYQCAWCHRTSQNTPGLQLHAAHVYAVGARPRMRFMLENAITLCYRDHIHKAHRDGGLMEWCDANLPKARMARLHLTAAARSNGKIDLAGVRLYLEAEAAKLGVDLPPAPKL